jgi:SAM-dependent methyltransferase
MIYSRDLEAARAWTSFWDEQGEGSHCLAGAPPDVRRVLMRHWHSFAATLPARAAVLDIGCGAGAVAQALIEAAPTLKVTGIDFADIRVSRNEQINLLPGVAMEALPFADGAFDAAVSQFGFEYGRTAEAAAEMARILRPGAPFSILVHHSQSPILSDLPAHKRAIEGLSGAQLQAAFLSGDRAELDRALSALKQQSPGLNIVEFAARGLHANIGKSDLQRAIVWKAVVEALMPEHVLIEDQERSCVAPDRVSRWLRPFANAFELAPISTLVIRGGVPIAWKFEGRRKSTSVDDGKDGRPEASTSCLHPLFLAMAGTCPNYPKSKPPSGGLSTS